MSVVVVEKCRYYILGFCKLIRKENCYRKCHPDKTCKKENFKSEECRKRHPRSCKYNEACQFQTNCTYKHIRPEPNANAMPNENEDLNGLINQIEVRKSEIKLWKIQNDNKVNTFVKVHLHELKDLKSIIEELRKKNS